MREEDRGPKGEKREAILQAALHLIAERGLQHTPMSLIAKQARASAGVIYHYFESKEDLLASLYCRIKGDMGRAIVAADDPEQSPAKRFQTLWLSIFQYCLAHPQETGFLEQYESVPKARQPETWLPAGARTIDDLIAGLRARDLTEDLPAEARVLIGLLADLRAGNLVKDLPLAVIGEFTLGVAHRLARQAGPMNLDGATLAAIAESCWDAIAR